jgi:hypothetical protein
MQNAIEELASAISVNRPGIFLSQVHWCKAILQARGIAPESFRHSIKCPRDVLATDLPEQARPPAAEYVGLALDALDGPGADASVR